MFSKYLMSDICRMYVIVTISLWYLIMGAQELYMALGSLQPGM